jgi:hypothetical protein
VPSPSRVARPTLEKATQRHLLGRLGQHDAVVASVKYPTVGKMRGGHRWAWPLLVAAHASLTGALSGGEPCHVEHWPHCRALWRAFRLAAFRGVHETVSPQVTIVYESRLVRF